MERQAKTIAPYGQNSEKANKGEFGNKQSFVNKNDLNIDLANVSNQKQNDENNIFNRLASARIGNVKSQKNSLAGSDLTVSQSAMLLTRKLEAQGT